MLKHLNIQSWLKIIFLILVIILVIWFLTARHGAERIALGIFPSIQKNIETKSQIVKDKKKLVEENEQLRKDNMEYAAMISMLVDENQSLLQRNEISRFWEENPGIYGEIARIFLKDPYGLYSTFLIDKGLNQGIKENMPVLGMREVIGRVIEVHPEFSRVRTIKSSNLAFGAVIKRTRELGVIVGGRKELKLTYLTINSDVSPGDAIITSGTTDITPAGLPLGTVREVVRLEVEEELIVKVESSEDIGKLDYVLVVTATQPIPADVSLEEGNV